MFPELDQFDPLHVRQIAKYKSETSLLFFTRYHYFQRNNGAKYIVAKPHKIIADALERVLRGQCRRLIINCAPRLGKTELAVKSFIAHGLALNPAAKFIHLTYSAELALDNSEAARDIVLSEDYQAMFDVKVKKDSKAKAKWYTDAGGGVYAAATGGQVTGFGAGQMSKREIEKIEKEEDEDLEEFISGISTLQAKKQFGGAIIIDDPIKPEDAFSERRRSKVNERFETTIRSRTNSRETPIILIQQRVHAMDLSGYLMEIEPGDWEVITLPCLQDDGTSIWEEKWTVAELLKLKRINEYIFDSQYQQRPSKVKRGGEFLYNFEYSKHVKKVFRNPELPIHITMDSNVYPYIAISAWQIKNSGAIDGPKAVSQIKELPAEDPENTATKAGKKIVAWLQSISYNDVVYLYGDKSTKNRNNIDDDKRSFFQIVEETIQNGGFVTKDLILRAPSSVGTVCEFVNELLSGESKYGIEIQIDEGCQYSIGDYQNVKRDENGNMVKVRIPHPVLDDVTYEKEGHLTDAMKDFLVQVFPKQFEDFKNRHKKLRPGGVSVKSHRPKVTP